MKNTLIKLRPCISTTDQRGSLTSLMALFTSGFSELLGMRSWFKSNHGVTRTGYYLLYPHTNLVLPRVLWFTQNLCGGLELASWSLAR